MGSVTNRRPDRIGGDVRAGTGPSIPALGTAPTTDRRLLRGARTRKIVLRAAVDVASADGLDGVSFGRLASATGLSKAGIQTLFPTKEALQLATAEYARQMFAEAVTEPAVSAPHGVARVRALVGHWMDYASTPLFAGGCFWGATLSEFDSRPGPVRDLLFTHQQQWLDLLGYEIGRAVAAGELAEQEPELLAFQIDAVLRSTNIALQHGDEGAADRANRVVGSLLAAPR